MNKLNADQIIERQLLTIDRHLWKTLDDIQKSCGEIFANYVFKNPRLADLAQETIKKIEEEKEEIKNAHKRNKENTPVFQWTV